MVVEGCVGGEVSVEKTFSGWVILIDGASVGVMRSHAYTEVYVDGEIGDVVEEYVILLVRAITGDKDVVFGDQNSLYDRGAIYR